jgi:hypothetical protein
VVGQLETGSGYSGYCAIGERRPRVASHAGCRSARNQVSEGANPAVTYRRGFQATARCPVLYPFVLVARISRSTGVLKSVVGNSRRTFIERLDSSFSMK